MRTRSTLAILAMVCLTLSRSTQIQAQTAAKTDFLEVVKGHFNKWDADKSRSLSTVEIENAVHDPQVKGKAAAAAASLRRAIRANHALDPITLEQLSDAVHHTGEADTKVPRYETMYKSALERIATANRALFVSEMPSVNSIGQGHLGDCFLLATMGTVAANDPARFRKMFKPLPNDKVEVTLGAGKIFVMDMPTDAEICIGAHNRNDGMWAIAFEKAMGTVALEHSKSGKYTTPLSIIGVGGNPAFVLSQLTGHQVKRTGCEDFQNGKLKTDAEREARLAEIRKKLIEAKSKGRLIVGGTAALGGKQTVVPGLYYNHSYGVLNYDEKTDEVTFWNPFGNAYTPKSGEQGLKHGYKTSHGQFTMPLGDAVMWFGSFSIEQNEPLKS